MHFGIVADFLGKDLENLLILSVVPHICLRSFLTTCFVLEIHPIFSNLEFTTHTLKLIENDIDQFSSTLEILLVILIEDVCCPLRLGVPFILLGALESPAVATLLVHLCLCGNLFI